MRGTKRIVLSAAVAAMLVVPGAAPADPGEVILNPFGNLSLQVVAEPDGATPGQARLRIHTANGQVTGDGTRAYFGLRVMAPEGTQMTGFALTGDGGCIVSDFAGAETEGGWQLGDVFGASAPTLGSLNSNMRMVGGFLEKPCGDLTIDEVATISTQIRDTAGDEAEIFFGTVHDPLLEGEVRVTVIATGFDDSAHAAEESRLNGVVVTMADWRQQAEQLAPGD